MKIYCCWIALYLYLVFPNKCHYNPFLLRAPIPMNSLLTLLRPLVITLPLSPHQGRCLCANVSMWSNCNLSSGPDYPNHRSSSKVLKYLKVWKYRSIALGRFNRKPVSKQSKLKRLQCCTVNWVPNCVSAQTHLCTLSLFSLCSSLLNMQWQRNVGPNCRSFIGSYCVKTIENDAFQLNNWL